MGKAITKKTTEQINDIRNILEEAFVENNMSANKEIILLSEMLDVLILEYYQAKQSDALFNK
ncbi:Spo0E family sporulation regulatory protein-aspartic acid phosphatase [Anaerosolibacter sp.]|uniref:Spo0E family sporulation regulatory protein-aspartic acid phosphatase n=1 Tax=Anaerosolibacter sp. TaxID=1872527 RepID=UPI0039EED7FB